MSVTPFNFHYPCLRPDPTATAMCDVAFDGSAIVLANRRARWLQHSDDASWPRRICLLDVTRSARFRILSGCRAGEVVSISRYPVKSMRAEPLEGAALHWPWLHGDRQYAFVKQANTSAFPWLTARDVPDLVLFQARYDRPDDPVHSAVCVTDPEGADLDIRDPALAARLSDAAGAEVSLLRLGRGCFDAMAVSVLTTTMAAAVEHAHGGAVAIERFRANVVIQPDDRATTERAWLGQALAIGTEGACLDIGWETPRCAMVGIDAGTGKRDSAVVRTVARRFDNRVGAYCSVRRPGSIRVGDAVTLIAV